MAGGLRDDRYRLAIARLASARKKAGLSQSALAERLKVRQQFVSKYECYERRLDVVEYIDVAKALSVDWIDFLGSL